jgi:hypothetical protein
MLKILNIFFVTLGVIFLFILLLASYVFVADPFNLKSLTPQIQPATTSEMETNSEAPAEESTLPESKPESKLSPTQVKALDFIGIEPEAIPQSFTAAQIACFEGILGQARVEEIKQGDAPSVTEFFKARSCLE